MTAWLASRCMLLVHHRAGLVDHHDADGYPGCQVVVAAQQEIGWMRASRAGGMRTLTTGLAGQQQARSARGGGPDQTPLSSAWTTSCRCVAETRPGTYK